MIELRPYQEEAKRRALQHDGFLLLMEQRSGKTPVACAVVKERDPERLLIACPKVAIPEWEHHLKLFKIQAETKIINFESLRGERKDLRKWAPDFVIGDETQRIKRRGSKQSRALRNISKHARWKLALSGTPMDAGIQDFWAQFDFVDHSVFGTFKEFEDEHLEYGGFRGYKIIGTRNMKRFNAQLAKYSYRVLLEDVKEKKTDIAEPNIVRFDLQESRPPYDSMEQKFIVEIKESRKRVKRLVLDPRTGRRKFVKRRKQTILATRVITKVMKLHQLSGGFILDENRVVHRFGWEKLTQAGALILALRPAKVVVYVRFIPELLRLKLLCERLGLSVQVIRGRRRRRKQEVQARFVFSADVVIAQIRSGVSIDLAAAQEAIFYSWGYSHLDHDQAKFRIRSYSSSRARYHYLIANNTIDEDLYQCVVDKLKLATLILNKYRKE